VNPSLQRVLWWDQLPEDLRAPIGIPLPGSVTADVAIVGAGFTGLWTAYALQQLSPELRIAVIEQEIAGFGASGRNGGWASALFPQDDLALTRRVGLPAALAMRAAMNQAVDDIGAIASDHGWDIDWAKGGTVVAARTPAQLSAMRADLTAQHDAGLSVETALLTASELRAITRMSDALGGTFTSHCAAIQPAKLVRNLARHLVDAGIHLYEHTPATALEPGVVRTTRGDVRARYVVRATEGYTARLPHYRRHIVPVSSLMIATEPLGDDVWDEIGLADRTTFSDGRHLIIYGQRTADGRIAFGGRGAPYRFGSIVDPRSEINAGIHGMLGRTLVELFPVLRGAKITHAWGGALGIARDWWASVGFDRRTGLGWSGGYVGDGVTTSYLGGRTLAALITDTPDPLTQLPWVHHESPRWEPEPLRWAGLTLGLKAMASSDRVEGRTGKPARRTRLMRSFIGH